MPAPSRGGAALTALVLSGLAGLGAAGIAVRQRALGPGLAKVQPGLRAPLLVLGRGSGGEADAHGSSPGWRLLSQATNTVVPAGLGRRRLVTGAEGAVPVWTYETDDRRRDGATGALVWMHGGGLVAGTPVQDHGLCNRIARDLNCLVVNVDYRLAPEHPYPAAIDDVAAVLGWLHSHARALGVDPARVAVGGASAGGGLAAALAQRAFDEHLPVAFQMLIYPMLDDRTGADGPVPGRGEFVWTAADNAAGWTAYLGRPAGGQEDRPWAVAARRQHLEGLAPAWIGVGDLDLFLDEDVDYALALEEAGVRAHLRVEPGMYHGADLCTWAASMRDFRSEAIEALGRALRPSAPAGAPGSE